MTEPEKIKVPAFEAAQRYAAEREEALGKLRGWLKEEHRKALEEDPMRHFTFKTPTDLLKDLTPQEKERLQGFEETTFARLKPRAQEKADKRRFAIAAGSSAEDFEREWTEIGSEVATAQRAHDIEERARRASSPY